MVSSVQNVKWCHRRSAHILLPPKTEWYNLWSFNSWICLAFWFHRKHCGPHIAGSSHGAGILACHLPPFTDYTLEQSEIQVGWSGQMHLSRATCSSTLLLQCTRKRLRPLLFRHSLSYLVFNYSIIAIYFVRCIRRLFCSFASHLERFARVLCRCCAVAFNLCTTISSFGRIVTVRVQ